MGIVERSHVTLGLVEHQIDLLLALDTAVVEFHLVRRLDFRSQRRHDHPIDGHQPAWMKSSASRREQIPDWAMKRFRRISPVGLLGLYLG